MPTSTPEHNVQDPASWGVAAHGAELVINPAYSPFVPYMPSVIDVENNPDGSCAGVGICCDSDVIHFFTEDVVMGWPKDFFNEIALCGHNIKYDVQMLHKWGFSVSPSQIIWDTQIAEYVKDSSLNRYGLKKLVKDIFGSSYPSFADLTGKGKKAVQFSELPLDVRANYNGCDVLFTYKLMDKQLNEFTKEQAAYMEAIELPAARVLLEMEERGVQIDFNYLRSLDTGFNNRIVSVVRSIRSAAESEINPNSWRQVKQLLLDKAGLHVKNTSAEELEKHNSIPIVKDILTYRGLAKLRGTYTKPLLEQADKKGRIHARFNQTVTITGRLSSSEPNLQNIPVRSEDGALLRAGFVAKPGHKLIDVDYSQIQPSLMAHYSQDPKMLDVFNSNKSIYSLVADICMLQKELKLPPKEEKAVAKVLWLALAFNAGSYALAAQSGLSVEQCRTFIYRMEKELGTFFYWKNKTIAQTEIDGHVTTLFGRCIPIVKEWAHLGPNYLMQGGESEIMKLAQDATKHLNPIIVCHDELLFEVAEDQVEASVKEIEALMSNIMTLSVPLRVEIGVGDTWKEAKK